jgi:BirA family biotin operon repressor/biotin-[acetyl-CoA-carboxylase] ligase
MPLFDEERYAALLAAGRGDAGGAAAPSVGGTVRFRERTTSTMDDARAGAEQDGLASCGSAYLAGEQQAGRGRQGRRWESAPGSALLVTYHLCGSTEQAALASAAGALATGDALRSAARLEAGCKWPNDLVVAAGAAGERKLAGILVEVLRPADGRVDVLLGIGVNLRGAGALPPELRVLATGVVEAGGRVVSVEDLLAALSTALAERWRQAAEEPAALLAAWRARLVTLGRRVRLAVPATGPGAREVEGDAVDVTSTGELVLRLADGSTASFAAADERSVRP